MKTGIFSSTGMTLIQTLTWTKGGFPGPENTEIRSTTVTASYRTVDKWLRNVSFFSLRTKIVWTCNLRMNSPSYGCRGVRDWAGAFTRCYDVSKEPPGRATPEQRPQRTEVAITPIKMRKRRRKLPKKIQLYYENTYWTVSLPQGT